MSSYQEEYDASASTEDSLGPSGPINPDCSFSQEPCRLSSPMRKVISHIFGRNKVATAAITDEMIPKICRKHYQRARYRVGIFGLMQWRLVQQVLRRVREEGKIQCFDISIRKRAVIDGIEGAENAPEPENDPRGTIRNSRVPWEIAELLDAQTRYTLDETHWIMMGIEAVLLDAREKGENRFFPDIELLPVVGDCEGETMSEGLESIAETNGNSNSDAGLFFPEDDEMALDRLSLDDAGAEGDKQSKRCGKGKGKARDSGPPKRLQGARVLHLATRVSEPGPSGHARRRRLQAVRHVE